MSASKDIALTADVSFSGKPGDTWAALRALQAGIGAAADKVRDEVLAPFSDEAGVNSYKTPLGKVYSSTKEERVEILPSADLMDWLRENQDHSPDRENNVVQPAIVPEHYEDQFDDRQVEQAMSAMAPWGASDLAVLRERARIVLRAALRARLVPEKVAPWVIPYLTERAKIVHATGPGFGDDDPTTDQSYVIDSVSGEEWPWATVVPESVTWNVRLTDDVKIAAGNAILERIDTVTAMLELEK